MKRSLVIMGVLLILASMLITGCSKTEEAPAQQQTSSSTTSTTTSTTTTATTSGTTTESQETAQPAKTYKWRLQAFMPTSDDLYAIYISKNLVEKISEATKGQVQITTYPGGALVPPTEIFKSTAGGIVEIGYTATSYQLGSIPVTAVADGLPMSFRNYEDLITCFRDKGLGDILAEEYAKKGVHLLTIHCTEPYTVLSSKPLITESDWEGTKIRGWGIWNKYFGELGASAVDMPLKDVYMALSMGTIDGCITGVNPHWQLKHYEVCNYGVWPSLAGSSSHDIYINDDAWNSLTPELQSAITKAAEEWTDETAASWAAFANENKENLSNNGITWQDVENRDWLIERAMTLWDDTAAVDEQSAKAVQILTDYLKEVGAVK